MAILFKCKMCGGSIEFEPGSTVGVCDSCGTRQTLPRIDDEKRANLYDRANHYRRNNQFDKAMAIYEQILDEDRTDAEAYWSLVLCSYGVSYVEDPSTRRRVPTLNRMQRTSIYNDENYKAALHYADAAQKQLYEAEAQVIAQVQKGYNDIALNEKPFDVFICYKESDVAGNRTQDSVIAEDLYNNLTKEGYKVFFSRITLEDKLGEAYEPYIYAALNSARVMVVVGTSPDNFNAVWVKNEWSRYLALIRNGESKTLIPAYRGMDPYDLPMEFSDKQGQDMSKVGCMQDLVRGIKKIVPLEEQSPQSRSIPLSSWDVVSEPSAPAVNQTVVVNSSASVQSLLERVEIFLNERQWEKADEYCERVLDIDPRNGRAYLGKMLAQYQASSLLWLPVYVRCNPAEFSKVLEYADDDLKQEIQDLITETKDGIKDGEYFRAKQSIKKAEKHEADGGLSGFEWACQDYKDAIKILQDISGWEDADQLIEECQQSMGRVGRKIPDARYAVAKSKTEEGIALMEKGEYLGNLR